KESTAPPLFGISELVFENLRGVLVIGRALHRLAIHHRDLLGAKADAHFKSCSTKLLEIFVDGGYSPIVLKLSFGRENWGKARVAVIARCQKLLPFRVPCDHSLSVRVF